MPGTRLCLGSDLASRASLTGISFPEADSTWQLPASTAPPRLRQAGAYGKWKREGMVKDKEGREDVYVTFIGVSQPREKLYLLARMQS